VIGPASLPAVVWGIPGRGSAKGKAPLFSASASVPLPDTKEAGYFRTWVDKLVRPRVLARDSEGVSRCEHVEERHESLEPSVIFATVINASDGAICMTISDNVSQVVGGFNDNCVRVWKLDEQCGAVDAARLPAGKRPRPSSTNSSYDYIFPLPTASLEESRNVHFSTERESRLSQFWGHTGPVYGVSQYQDGGNLVLSCSADESARLWDLSIGQCVAKYSTLAPGWDVSFGPLGYYFAVATANSVCAFATDNISPIRIMTGHVSDVTCVRWHGNGSLLASGSDDKTCRLWDLRTGDCERLLRQSTSSISSVCCSPNGNLIAAGTDNGAIDIWDVGTGRHLTKLRGHVGPVHSLGFSADGDALATGGADCTVRVWNLLSGIDHSSGDNCSHSSQTFHTKFTSVYHVHYSKHNLLCAGGPFSLALATAGSQASH
jgi:transcription initiation factor TFIID subunit 5